MSETTVLPAEVVVCGWLRVRPDDRDGYLETCREVVALGRAATGCLDFAISADLVDPGRINVVERWTSRQAVEAFRGEGTPEEQRAVIVGAEVVEVDVAAVRSLT